MKPFTPTVLGEALGLVTTPGILEWQNCGVNAHKQAPEQQLVWAEG